jgi:hypothetical protein
VAGPVLDPRQAWVTFPLNLKPFGPCAALQQGEIPGTSDALILSMAIPVKGNPVCRIRCDVFHSREQAHVRVGRA